MSGVKISELRAQVLDANQCAARALEGRDQMIREVERLERALKNLPVQVSDERERALRNKLELVLAAHAHAVWQNKVLRAEIRLDKLRKAGPDKLCG